MKFSVLVSVYNKEKPANFSAALQSVIEQSLAPSEIVLIVDGPLSEQLEQVITDFTTNYPTLFKIFRFDTNGGLGFALKKGVELASYEIIARMDTDDISMNDRFAKQVAFLQSHPHIDVVGSNIEEFNYVPGDLKVYKIMPEAGAELLAYAKYRNPLNHPTIMFRKSAVLAAGNYSGEIPLFEDYVLFVKMILQNIKFHNIQETLLFFRVDDGLQVLSKRSGWPYLKNEVQFLKFARSVGYLNAVEFGFAIVLKTITRLLPKQILKGVYLRFLRQSNKL